jgi:hypothetical protein
MTAVHIDSHLPDAARRMRVYAGDVFVYSPTPSSLELVRLARVALAAAFPGDDPEFAQFHMSVEAYAEILGHIKPAFIHDPRCKQLLPAILNELGCSPDATYFDVPRMRSSTSDGYLTTGIAYAFQPHRDTWYSAPMSQINWWLPVFPLQADNCMAFLPRHWSQGLKNTSAEYNYQEWNRTSRYDAARHVGIDTRNQPHAIERIELEPDLRILPPPGGLVIFSAAQLHASIPNTSGRTRFSLDFRTVHLDDARTLTGARNIDSFATGSTMGDYLRASDLAHLPADVMEMYAAGHPQSVIAD